MQPRNFLRNLAFLLFVNLLVKPFWILGVDRSVQNTVGTEDYGLYFALLNFSFLFSMVLDFGISNFNNRAIARNEGLLTNFLPRIFALKMGLAVGYGILSIATALLIGMWQVPELLLLLLANQVLVSFTLYFRSNIAAQQRFRTDAILSVTDRLLMIALVGAMLWGTWGGFEFSIRWFVYGQTAAYLLTAGIAFGVVLAGKGIRFALPEKGFLKIMRMSAPFALLGILMGLYNRIDAIMIDRLLPSGATEAGIYAASYRLLDAANMIGFAFASILLPLFARMLKQRQDVRPILDTAFRTMLFLGLSAAVLSFAFRHPIMELLYIEYTAYWGRIFGWLMVSFVGVSTMYIYGSLLTAHGSLGALNRLAIGGVVLNVALNAVLIPKYGALGATWATVATQWLVAAGHIVLAGRLLRLHPGIKLWGRATLFAFLAVLSAWAALRMPLSWPWQFVAATVATGILGIGSTLLPVRQLGELRKVE